MYHSSNTEVRGFLFYQVCPRVEVHIASLGSFYSMSHFARNIFFLKTGSQVTQVGLKVVI